MNTPIRTFAWPLAGLFLVVAALRAQQHPQVYDGSINVKTVVPVISVETTGPSDINVGKTATFVITVKNVGDTPAEELVVRTHLPKTVEYEGARPKPEAVEDGTIRFYLGDLKAKASRRITLNLIPQKQGPVDLATKASFSTSTRSSLHVRQSSLKIKALGPTRALYGQTVTFKLIVVNAGDGTAEDVTIVPQVPDGALPSAEAGKPIEIGILPAGESREALYTVNALASGSLELSFEAFDAAGSKVDTRAVVRVLHPMLNVAMEGPTLRYLNRAGQYTIHVTNPGDAPVENVEVIAAMSPGLRVTAIAKAAKYDRQANTLTWYLPSVDPGTEAILSLKAIATQIGQHAYQVVATNNAGLAANAEHVTQVIGRPNLYAAVINENGATEVDQPAGFTVLLVNHGQSPAANVEVAVDLSDELQPLPTDEASVEGRQLKFDPMTLNVGEQKELHFQAISRVAGEHLVRVSYKSDSMTQSLTIEADAFFYDDREPGTIAKRLELQASAEGPQLVPH